MKKIFFGLLLICSPLFATGPLYNSSSSVDQSEHENIYKDLRFPKISTGTAQNFYIRNGSATLSGLALTSGATISGISGRVIQVIVSSMTATGSTTSNCASAYVDTALQTRINHAASSYLFIWATFEASNSSAGNGSRFRLAGCGRATNNTVEVNAAGAEGDRRFAVALNDACVVSGETSTNFSVQMCAAAGTAKINDNGPTFQAYMVVAEVSQ